jgi:hypothetical protein
MAIVGPPWTREWNVLSACRDLSGLAMRVALPLLVVDFGVTPARTRESHLNSTGTGKVKAKTTAGSSRAAVIPALGGLRDDLDLATLRVLASHRLDPTPESVSGLLRAVSNNENYPRRIRHAV